MSGTPSVAAAVESMAAAFRSELNRLEGEGTYQSHDLTSLRGIPAAFRGLVAHLAEHDLLLDGEGRFIPRTARNDE